MAQSTHPQSADHHHALGWSGILAGGVFGLCQVLAGAPWGSRVSIEVLLGTLLWVWSSAVLIGVLAASVWGLVLRLVAKGRLSQESGERARLAGLWPGVFVFAACVALEVVTGGWLAPLAAGARLTLGAAAGLAVFAIGTVLYTRWPALGSNRIWADVQLAALVLVLLALTVSVPLRHTASALALLLLLPPAVVSVMAPLLVRHEEGDAQVVGGVDAEAAASSRGAAVRGPAARPSFRSPRLAPLTDLLLVRTGLLAIALLIVTATWVILPLLGGGGDAQSGPNVLMITVDGLRPGVLGCYGGGPETPCIDRLAARGVRFETVVSPSPVSLPAHVSLLSGLVPPRHGLRLQSGDRTRAGVLTLPEILGARGYLTAAFINNPDLCRSEAGLYRHFQRFDDGRGELDVMPAMAGEVGFARLLAGGWVARADARSILPTRPAAACFRRAARWLELNRDAPFCLWVHARMPPTLDSELAADLDGQHATMSRASLAHLDALIGTLVDRLAALDRLDDTLIVVTSTGGSGGARDNKSLDDESLLVPLVFCAPDFGDDGRVARRLVRLIDVAPTVLDFAGLTVPRSLDGASLVDRWIVAGEAAPVRAPSRRVAWAELASVDARAATLLRAIRTERYKYIYATAPWVNKVRVAGSERLFDLQVDPGESVNVIDRDVELTRKFRALARALDVRSSQPPLGDLEPVDAFVEAVSVRSD